MPLAEVFLWQELRTNKICHLKFRRQFGIGSYIADFYCPQLKLVIEVDGDSHMDQRAQEYDLERSTYFFGLGITTLRFTNDEVLQSLDTVVERIQEFVIPLLTKEG